jgi:hypothetical protein
MVFGIKSRLLIGMGNKEWDIVSRIFRWYEPTKKSIE